MLPEYNRILPLDMDVRNYSGSGSGSGSDQAARTVTKNRRTLGPKVKSGCVTCKIRRVKCDEGKPGCKRCFKFGQLCGGYEGRQRPKKYAELPRKPRRLAPVQNTYITIQQPVYQNEYHAISHVSIQRVEDAHTSMQPTRRVPPTEPFTADQSNFVTILPLLRPPPRDLFRTDEERLYFQRFCEESATQLTGCFVESDLWSRVVLQASEADSCIRHAVTAIGTLNLKGWKDNNQRLEKRRLEFAYHEYNSAIVGMRQSTLEGQTDIRTKLLACLLFACFETYHGNRDVATAQVFAGIEAIDEYNRLRMQARYSGTSIPPIDEEIVRIFVVLEIQATTYQDQRSNALHLERLNRGRAAVEDMPSEFTSLKQARLPLTRIVLRGIHLTMSQRDSGVTHPSMVHLWWVSEPRDAEPTPSISTVDPVYALQCNILSEYRAWCAAFEPLLRKAKGPKGKYLYFPAILLRIHYLSGYLCLAATMPHPKYYHRCYTSELAETVALARELLDNPQKSTLGDSYSLDIGVVMPLVVVGWKFRHRQLRRIVIEIFSTVPRREGIWDVVITGRVMQWIRGIEEVDLPGEEEMAYVPEERVATISKMETDLVRRETRLGCLVRPGGVGEKELMETVIYW